MATQAASAGRGPNILLITSDQQHWRTLGLLNPEVQTPHLDGLALAGTRFSRAYCPNPTCTPTRASMITGLYPSQHGAWSLGTKLPETVHTVGEDFTRSGYRTALVGKAHFQPLRGTDEFPSLESYPTLQDLDFWRDFDGPFYGFDHVELARNHTNEAHVGQHYALWMQERGCENWREYFLAPTGSMDPDIRRVWPIPEEYHYDTWIADRTCALLDAYKERGEAFFLWSSFFDPHPTYLVPEPWASMYDPAALTVPTVARGEHEKSPPHTKLTQEARPDFSPWDETRMGLHGFHSHVHGETELRRDIATYYGMISLMDKHIGAILKHLENLGLADNTVVVFTTDHGHFFGHHGLVAKGAFHYEDMIRVPLIVRHPGHVPAGRETSALQSLVDFAPTLLGLCGIAAPRGMAGIDQSAVWAGEREAVRDHCIVENRHEPTTVHVKTFVEQRYKITVYYNHGYGELFDLEEDPGELNNLWGNPAAASLKSDLLLRFLWGEMGKEPLWMPRVYGA